MKSKVLINQHDKLIYAARRVKIMPGKALVLVFCIILMFILTVYCIELFIPLKLKIDFNDCCRQALIKAENNGGLTDEIRESLNDSLKNIGFENVQIICDSDVKKGDEINLKVYAEYERKKFEDLFNRENITDQYYYNKTTISRKVVN